MSDRILGEEVLVTGYGLGRVTELPRSDEAGRWIAVTPYVAGYKMKFAPENVHNSPTTELLTRILATRSTLHE